MTNTPTTPTARHAQVDPPTLGDHRGHVVYAMPVFVRLASPDLMRSVAFFTEVLDFDLMFLGPEVAGVPVLVHLRRAKYQDLLVMPARAPVQAGSALAISFSVEHADALDALAAQIRQAGVSLDGPADTPWNARELTVRDPHGNAFVFTTRPRAPRAGSVDAIVRDAAG